MRAVGYIRSSTDKQDNSCDAQEKRIRAQSLVNPDLKIVGIEIDDNKFSGDLNRPGIQRVLEMVKAKQVDAVIVCKLDRLTRSTRDVIELIELFSKKKVALISLSESLDTESPIGQFVVKILASFAEMERQLIGNRTREGLANIREQGFPIGEAPYGFTSQPRTPEEKEARIRKPLLPNKEEQKILKVIKAGMGFHGSYKQIAEELNAAGYKTRTGSAWVPQRVYGIWKTLQKAGER